MLTRILFQNCRISTKNLLKMSSTGALDRIIANNNIAQESLAALKREVVI